MFSGLANITVNTSANGASQYIQLSAPNPGGGAALPQYFKEIMNIRSFNLISNITAINGTMIFIPFMLEGTLSANEMHWMMSRATSGSNHFSFHHGVYSFNNSSALGLISSASTAFSNTATVSVSGARMFEAPFALTSMTPGQYVLGMLFTATATASMNYSIMGNATVNPGLGVVAAGSDQYHTYTNHVAVPFLGRYSVATAAIPGTVGSNSIRAALSGASAPIPAWIALANHY
jgi:hypothetical protein